MTSSIFAIVPLMLVLCDSPRPDAGRPAEIPEADRLEVRHSMLGFRDTLIFYIFEDQRAVLRLSIGNRDESFPVTGTVYLFDRAATAEGLKGWVNNQHSDALYPDVPEPIFTGKLPGEACKVISSKNVGKSKNPGPREGEFTDFEVEFSVRPHAFGNQFELPGFTDRAGVHVEKRRPAAGRS